MRLLKPLRTLHVLLTAVGIIFSIISILTIGASIIQSLGSEPVGKGPETSPTPGLQDIGIAILLVGILGFEGPIYGLPIFLLFFAWFYYRELRKDTATIARREALIKKSLKISSLIILACTGLLLLYFTGSFILTSVVIIPISSLIYLLTFRYISTHE